MCTYYVSAIFTLWGAEGYIHKSVIHNNILSVKYKLAKKEVSEIMLLTND